jgi:segregation and condensation protein A
VFARGALDGREVEVEPFCELTIEDLVRALGVPHGDNKPATYVVASTRLYSIEESIARLRRLLGAAPEWDTLQNFLPEARDQDPPLERRSALASSPRPWSLRETVSWTYARTPCSDRSLCGGAR